MFEKWRIKEHMEVADSAGQHIGTVDSVDDGRIKLTRTDSPDGAHHYVDIDMVDRIDDNRVYLKDGAVQPFTTGSDDVFVASNAPGSADVADSYSRNSTADTTPQERDQALFGTSGHGTGMGGGGVG